MPDEQDDGLAKSNGDAAANNAWVLTDAYEIAGFAVATRRSPGGAEILWIAVDSARPGRWLGTRILDAMLADLAAAGVSVVEAKTLDYTAGYPPCEATRAFWERRGFVQVDTIDPLTRVPATQPGGHLRCGSAAHPVMGARSQSGSGLRRSLAI